VALLTVRVVALAAAALAVGCGEARLPPATAAPTAAADPGRAPEPEPEVMLADTPRIDLLHNRHRFHLHVDGLLVPLAAEGLRKYSQEYRRPWKGLAEVDGRPGRVLGERSAVLRVPFEGDGEATVRLWLHGLVAGQRVQVDVNGRRAGVVSAGAAWAEHTIAVPAGLLRRGENELRLHVGKQGRAGAEKSWALHHALELVGGAAGPSGRWPGLDAVATASFGGEARPSLGGFPRLELLLEIPETAWLEVHLGGGGRHRIAARTSDGTRRTLLDAAAADGWSRRRVSLAALAGQLVALELSAEGGGVFGAPVIALEEAPIRARPAPVPNVILLVVDALRSDRLQLYGETRVRTPRMTAEAERRGVLFLHNQAASPSSPPSHASLQTGMIPRVHGVVGDTAKLTPGTPLLSAQLGDAGIVTAYVGNNGFGMNRLRAAGRWSIFRQPRGMDCNALVPEVLTIVREQRAAGKRFFVSAIPFEPHTPYRYHPGLTDRFHAGPWDAPVGKSVDGVLLSALAEGRQTLTDPQWQQLFALYDGEVEHWDACFGRLIEGLAELGATEDTAIVVTADHGEGMFEHGRGGHAFGQYAELTNVPLVIYADGLTDGLRRLDAVSSCLDVAPTILDLMGVPADERIQGVSVLPAILRQGPHLPRVVSSEYGRSYGLKTRAWKLVVEYDGTERVYDHASDPTEQRDLAGVAAMPHRYLREAAGFFLAHREAWRASSWGTLADHGPGFLEHVTR
jgi:arylsulfatase A-like enzyme